MITDDSVAIVVMAKAPEPGQVKTRLVPPLSAGGAAVLAARFARRTLTTAVAAALGPVTLGCAPDATHEFFKVCARRHGVTLVDQGDGDLGARMQRMLATALERHRRVLLLGTDVPSVEPHVTVISVSESMSSPRYHIVFFAIASRKSLTPHVIAYWL